MRTEVQHLYIKVIQLFEEMISTCIKISTTPRKFAELKLCDLYIKVQLLCFNYEDQDLLGFSSF